MSTEKKAALRFGDPASIRERDHARMQAIVKDFIEADSDEVACVVIEHLSEADYERFFATEDGRRQAEILFEAASGNPALAKRLGI